MSSSAGRWAELHSPTLFVRRPSHCRFDGSFDWARQCNQIHSHSRVCLLQMMIGQQIMIEMCEMDALSTNRNVMGASRVRLVNGH
jgi:hypothetical protein